MRPAGAFNGIGNANPTQLAARLGFRTPRLKTRPIRGFQCQRHILREIAAVIGVIQPGAKRHRFRRDQIFLAERNPVHAHFIRSQVNDAFNGINRLWPPGAAIGCGWLRMRENAAHFGEDMRRAIHPREPTDIISGGNGPLPGKISTDIAQRMYTKAKEGTISGQRQFSR